MREENTDNASVGCLPTLRLELLAHFHEHLLVVRVGHLLDYPEVVTGHVVWRYLEILRVGRVHPIDINIHFVLLALNPSCVADCDTYAARPAFAAMSGLSLLKAWFLIIGTGQVRPLQKNKLR